MNISTNTNSTFFIGKEHIICEDYALSGINDDIAYAIVCDGCSASPDVDFGARLVAQSAKKAILTAKDCDPNYFGELIIRDANKILDIYPHLNKQTLDATLLMAWVKDNNVNIRMYGDGVIVHKSENSIYSVNISLSSGAPDYLSYYLNGKRMKLYMDIENNIKNIQEYKIEGDNKSLTNSITKPFDPFTLIRPVKTGDIISVISDGINSFINSSNVRLNWYDILNEFIDYKNVEGEFVIRRMNAFRRKCLKDGTTHYDDVGIASIVI